MKHAQNLSAALALAALSLVTQAGAADPERIDGIAAVVEDEVILRSEVEEEVFLAARRGQFDLGDSSAVAAQRLEILEALIESKVIYARAKAEGLRATREEIDSATQNMVDDIRSRFPSESSFQAELAREGTSVAEIEAEYRSKVEEQLLVRQLIDRDIRGRVRVQEEEVREYWDAHRAEIPPLPAGLELSRIVFRLDASDAVDSASVQRAEIVRGRLQAGEDFETLARAFSEGPAAFRGGDLGWFLLADIDPDLRSALEGAGAGTLTDVVLSSRGAHILQVEEVRANGIEMRARQIVFLRDEEAARASCRARAEGVALRLAAGEDFASLAASESEDPAASSTQGQLGRIPLEALRGPHLQALQDLEVGAVSEVLEDEEGFTIFRVDDRGEEREATFEEIRDRLSAGLEQEKLAELYREYVQKARESAFVDNRLLTAGS